MINNLIVTQELKLAMYEQHPEQLDSSALINRMRIKDEKMLQKLKKLSALLCATCEEIGKPDKPVIKIDFGPVVDDE